MKVPVEIARHILRYAVFYCRNPRPKRAYLPPYKRFIKYMLVSRVWCRLVAELIWCELNLTTADDMPFLLRRVWKPRSLSTSPQLVKSISITFAGEALPPKSPFYVLLGRLRNVRAVTLRGSDSKTMKSLNHHLPSVMAALPNIQHFTACLDVNVNNVPVDSLRNQLVEIVQSRQLHALHLELAEWFSLPRFVSPVLTDAIFNSALLRKLTLWSFNPFCLPALATSPLAKQLTELNVCFPRPSSNQETEWQDTYLLDTLAALCGACSQLRVFSIAQVASSIVSTPALWTLLEMLSSLPHLVKFEVRHGSGRHLEHTVLTEPPRMLTFAKVEQFAVECHNRPYAHQHLARFQWPSLKYICLRQGDCTPEDYQQLLKNAPRLRELVVELTAHTKKEGLSFLRLPARRVYPRVLSVVIWYPSWMSRAEMAGGPWNVALQRAFPRATIQFHKYERDPAPKCRCKRGGCH